VKVKNGDLEANLTTVHKLILHLLSMKFFDRLTPDMLVSGIILEAFTKPSAGSDPALIKDLLDTQSKSEENEAKSIRDGETIEEDENGTFKSGFNLSNSMMKD